MKGMEDWEHLGAIYFVASIPKVPVGISIIDRHVGRNNRRWRMSKSIKRITTIDIVSEASR